MTPNSPASTESVRHFEFAQSAVIYSCSPRAEMHLPCPVLDIEHRWLLLACVRATDASV